MTWETFQRKICSDLKTGSKSGRRFLLLFRKKYKGQKEAIEDMSVRFDDDGRLEFTLTINQKQKILKV